MHVEDYEVVVADEGLAVGRLADQHGAAEGQLQSVAGRLPAELDHRHGKGAGAERGNDLAGVGNDDLGLGDGCDDLLTQHCATTALDEAEVRVDFVGAVDSDVEAAKAVPIAHRNLVL